MTPPSTTRKLIAKICLSLTTLLLVSLPTAVIRADSTDGTTPLALQPGTPAGSYALSDLDHINPYNGALSFQLKLLSVAGRGAAGYTITFPIEQKWRINTLPIYQYLYEDGGGPPLPDPQVTYHYFPSANWWAGIKPGYGPGVLQGRVAQYDAQVCPDSMMRARFTLTRLTFTAPDGTEFELRDKQTDGTPASVGLCDVNGSNRGRVFVSADGSAATFISDDNIVDYILVPNGGNDLFYPSGYLLMRDGTRYRFDDGTVTWLRDRNGNKMTFTYDAFKRVTLIKDSINREVDITYATAGIAYDEIAYKGFGGAQRTIRVNYANLQDAGSLRSGYSIQTYYQLFPMVGASMSASYNPKIVRSITLPNNQQYQFQYNSYGELARVVVPTGGAFEYDHAGGFGGGDAAGIVGMGDSPNIYRRVVTRRVYDNGATLTRKVTFSGQNVIAGNTNYVLVDQFGSDGTTRLSQQKIYYEGFAENSFLLLPTDYSPWRDGREYQSESVAADGTTVLQRSARTWQQPVAGGSWPLTQAETNAAAKSNNPQITQVITTLEPAQANKVSKQTFAFDKYANQTDTFEFDFGTGAAGPLVRRSHTDYLTSSYDTLNPSATNPDLNSTYHLRSLPAQVSIFDAGGVERARSVIEYDDYDLDGSNCQQSFHCPLKARSNISGLDSSFGTSYTKRGNPTAITRYLLTNGVVTGSVSSYTHFDVAGNVTRRLDPRSTPSNIIATTIEYDDRFGAPDSEARANSVPSELTGNTSFAFPTKVINALGHTAYAQFDYYLGKPINGEDVNGVVSSGFFNDALDRPTQIRRGVGTSVANQTAFSYDDVGRSVTTSSDRDNNNDNILVGKVFYDQMGRTIETRQYEGGSNYIATQTQYNASGQAFKSSNPFRLWQGESVVWTTQAFDALGRVSSVTTPDNSVVSTSYSGNTVTVTDQAGKSRKSVMDALGRLREVHEDPVPGGLNYQTTYAYDVLDSLVTVTQGAQTRTFVYDSLKRLKSATNPESGTTTYSYDNNANLTQKIDARGIVSTYVYDVLNRNTTVDYSDTASINPDVSRLYDGATNGIGRLWSNYAGGTESSGSNVEKSIIDTYDALGRPLVQRQLFKTNGTWSQSYQTSRSYNRAGGVTAQIYPSGRSVIYNFDAAGRLADEDAQNLAFTGNLGDGVLRTYSRGITYASLGQLKQEQFGTTTPVYNKRFYNSRQQLAEILTSTTGGDSSWNRGKILNQYSLQCSGAGCNATDNNGNLRKQEVFIPANDQVSSYTSWYQQYDYDGVNRLKRVHEYTGNPQLDWQQEYLYDQWGNRRIDTANTYGTGINNKSFEKQDSTNRLYSPGDLALADNLRRIRYDASGNQIKDVYSGYGAATFDAENHITSIQDGYAAWSYYAYNADGKRTRRKINNQETWQVYGFGGEVLAEYAANSVPASPQKEYGYRNGELLITATPGSSHSLSGNGTSAYVNGPSSSSLNITGAITVEAWIKIDAIGAYRAIVSREAFQQAGTGGGYRLAITDTGKVRLDLFQSHNTYVTAIGTSSVTAGAWQHVAGVFDGNQIRIYLNGVQNGSVSTASGPASGTGGFYLGRFSYSFNPYYFNGLIDEARVSNVALYTSNFTPAGTLTATSSTKGLWRFDGQTATDFSTNGNNGTLQGGATFSTNIPGGGGSVPQVRWLVADHLGTPRIALDQTGSLAGVKRHDYLPFGEELFAATGSRGTTLGYASDGIRQQFTQKERDVESGLDHFMARYHASTQGRFTSSDPLLSSGSVHAPQTWNRYSYTTNNPLKYTDPFGMYVCVGTKDQCKDVEKGLNNLEKVRDSFKKGSYEYNQLDRSVKAYGANGVDNGVTIKFGATSNGAAAHVRIAPKIDGATGHKATTGNNPIGQDITVTIDPRQTTTSSDYVVNLGHEGSHVANGSDLVNSLPLNVNLGSLDAALVAALNGPLNLTQYVTESQAYEVTSFIGQGLGVGSLTVGKHEIWNSAWAEADRATKRSAGIDRILAEPKSSGGLYQVTPLNQGLKLIP